MIDINNITKIQDNLPVSSLILFFLIITADSMKTLAPCNLRKLSTSNLLYKHIVGFLTLLFFIELVEIADDKDSLISILKKTSILYFWFLLTTKMYYPLFIVILFVFLIIFMIHIYSKRGNINNETKEKIKKINNYLYIFSIIITIIGVLIYYSIKKKEYNNKFNILSFIFGTINEKCNVCNVNND